MKVDLSLEKTITLRGIAIICVILGHLKLLNIASFGVGIFLFLSGFGLTLSTEKNGLCGFWRKRVFKIWLPYFVVYLLGLMIDCFLYNKTYQLLDVLCSIIGINLSPKLDASMWYIGYLILWYILFYCCFRYFNNKYYILVGAFVILGISLSPLCMKAAGAFWYFLEFPLGCFCAWNYEKIKMIEIKKVYVVFAILMIFVFYMFSNYATFFMNIYVSTFTIIFLVSVCKSMSIIRYIGTISFEMYLFEAVLIWKYKFLFVTNTFVDYIVYFIFLITLSMLYKTLIDKYVVKKLLM